jgi:hypothetical protein
MRQPIARKVLIIGGYIRFSLKIISKRRIESQPTLLQCHTNTRPAADGHLQMSVPGVPLAMLFYCSNFERLGGIK